MTRYFAEAEAELIEAAQFYEDRQAALGFDFLEVIENATKKIEKSPNRSKIDFFQKNRKLHITMQKH